MPKPPLANFVIALPPPRKHHEPQSPLTGNELTVAHSCSPKPNSNNKEQDSLHPSSPSEPHRHSITQMKCLQDGLGGRNSQPGKPINSRGVGQGPRRRGFSSQSLRVLGAQAILCILVLYACCKKKKKNPYEYTLLGVYFSTYMIFTSIKLM